MRKLLMVSVAALGIFTTAPAFAGDEADTIADAITNGHVNVDLRYRLETVDQDGFNEDAKANTLRTKLKYTTANFRGFSAALEVENNLALTNDYNSTINGHTQYPVIADPKFTEINQAYLAYTGIKNTTLIAGRKGINLDNQRFVGTVGFRQNDQTYDSAIGVITPAKDITITGAYVWNVNRIFSEDHPFGNLDTNTIALNGNYTGFALGTLSAYGYFIDLNDMPVYGLSSQTIGARFTGNHAVSPSMKLLYEAEFATQSDYKDNPTDYSANYYHISGGLSMHGFTGKVGYEVLGSDDGNASFKTPLATLHKFNGWADKFLNTPNGGLEDLYISGSYKVKMEGPLNGLKFDAAYHDFSADVGNDYGSEIDLQATTKFMKNYSLGLKYASYNADGFATDTNKLWITLGAKF